MSNILEVMGKGLETSLMAVLLPGCETLDPAEVARLENKIAEEPQDLAYKLRLAVHMAQTAKTDPAQELFGQILGRDPHHLDTHFAWAGMHAGMTQLEAGVELLLKAAQYHGRDGRVWFSLGHLFERLGQMPEAIDAYRKAQTFKPHLRQVNERLGAIYLRQADIPASIGEFQKLQQEYPGEVWNYVILGQLYLHDGQHTAAQENFERALTIDPDNFAAHDDYVESLMQSGQNHDAIVELEHMLETQGDFPDSHVRLADLYALTSNDENAVAHYEKALEIHPSYLEALVKLGTQHLRQERLFESAGRFNQAVEVNDQLITSYLGLAMAYERNDRGELAADTFDLAQALEPNTHLLFAEVARIQIKLSLSDRQPDPLLSVSLSTDEGDQQERDNLMSLQLERHRQALMNYPNQADLHYRYGLLLRGRGQLGTAIKHFHIALEINPCYQQARVKLGLALRDKGRNSEAAEHFQKALSIVPEYIQLHYKLGLMYCDRLQFALAVEHFQLDKSLPSDESVQDNLALALQNMGLADRATATWQAVCQLDPQSKMAFLSQRSQISLKTVR